MKVNQNGSFRGYYGPKPPPFEGSKFWSSSDLHNNFYAIEGVPYPVTGTSRLYSSVESKDYHYLKSLNYEDISEDNNDGYNRLYRWL